MDITEEKERLAKVTKEFNEKLQKKQDKDDNHVYLHQKVQEYATFSDSESESESGFQELMDLKTNSVFDTTVVKYI